MTARRHSIVPPARLAPLVLLALAAAMLSCANVTVRKVPAPTQYRAWTDDHQTKSDAMEGVRFYMPRPYVRVKRPFVVRADVYLAHAVVSEQGDAAVISSIAPANALADPPHEFAPPPPELRSVPLRRVYWPQAPAEQLMHSLASPAETSQLSGPGTTTPPPPAEHTSGISTRGVTLDNAAFARTPLDGPFELLYLPDFEEQYVVSGDANLGDLSIALTLGQGWSLQGLNSSADNSALNQRLFALLDAASSLAITAARAAVAGAFPPAAAMDEAATSHEEVPEAPAAPAPSPGTPIVLRLAVLHHAAPGLYPILKPSELARETPTAPGDITRHVRFDTTSTIVAAPLLRAEPVTP